MITGLLGVNECTECVDVSHCTTSTWRRSIPTEGYMVEYRVASLIEDRTPSHIGAVPTKGDIGQNGVTFEIE